MERVAFSSNTVYNRKRFESWRDNLTVVKKKTFRVIYNQMNRSTDEQRKWTAAGFREMP